MQSLVYPAGLWLAMRIQRLGLTRMRCCCDRNARSSRCRWEQAIPCAARLPQQPHRTTIDASHPYSSASCCDTDRPRADEAALITVVCHPCPTAIVLLTLLCCNVDDVAAVRRDGESQSRLCRRCEIRSSVSPFPCICPEPVWANRRFPSVTD